MFLVTHSGFTLLAIFMSQAHKVGMLGSPDVGRAFPVHHLSSYLFVCISFSHRGILVFLSRRSFFALFSVSSKRRRISRRLFLFLCRNLLVGGLMMLMVPYVCFSSTRMLSIINNYRAPLLIYNHLYNELSNQTQQELSICLGKEWYRFGSSFFLPSENHHIRFIKSGFDGLLPQVFFGRLFDRSLLLVTMEPGLFLSI